MREENGNVPERPVIKADPTRHAASTTAPSAHSTLPSPGPSAANLLDRPPAERGREFKYRFGQSIVFGLPVVALQWFGRSLGGPESDRWVTLFQALLAGWVVYVAAAGMLSEAVLLILSRRRMPPAPLADATIALIAVLLYISGLPRLLLPNRWPAPFHWTVVLLAVWTGTRWWHTKNISAG